MYQLNIFLKLIFFARSYYAQKAEALTQSVRMFFGSNIIKICVKSIALVK